MSVKPKTLEKQRRIAAIRNTMMEGILDMPYQFVSLVGRDYMDVMEKMWYSLWFNYLKDKGSTSLPYWSKQFNNPMKFNKFLLHLSKAGWITTEVIPSRNWGEAMMREEKLLEFVTPEELSNIRAYKKFHHYTLDKTESTKANKTKLNGKIQDTGIVRAGFSRAGNTEFKYDAEFIVKYYDAIQLNLTKSMDKLNSDLAEQGKERYIDSADYGRVSVEILDYHIQNAEKIMNRGENVNDARGRAISSALAKVFNMISNKDARSLLVIPEEDREVMTKEAVRDVYLFIAELFGARKGTKFNKTCYGKRAYKERKLHILKLEEDIELIANITANEDLTPKEKTKLINKEKKRAEDDRSELHENIWLERLYSELDLYFKSLEEGKDCFYWSVPIEIDATASMIQHTGTLLGDYDYLDLTNVIGEELKDFWTVENLTRLQFKTVGTPTGYGSSQTPRVLLTKAKIPFTPKEIKLLNKELNSGRLALMNKFKEFIINNCNPQESMMIHIMDEKFKIECNRFSYVGDKYEDFLLYCSEEDTLKRITHTSTIKVPDLDQFRRFFVTLLVHNLDSQVADYVCQNINWIIDIHDAFIVSPTQAKNTRKYYAKKMEEIYERREEILANYFKSIGITSSSNADWAEVMKFVNPVTDYKCGYMALK